MVRRLSGLKLSGIFTALALIFSLSLVGYSLQHGHTVRASASSCIRMSIPSYFYPGPLWQQATAGSPTVAVMIVNPNSGPGATQDQNYVSTVADAKKAGIRVLGYVPTSYASRSTATVKTEIDDYKAWYGVTNIFLDEASSQSKDYAYYQDLADYIHQAQGAIVELNPGVYPAEGYMNIADIVNVYENPYTNYASAQIPSWAYNYPASKFAHLVYATPDSASMQSVVALAQQRNVGYLYVTNDDLPNPWDTLPSYWANEVSQLNATCPAPLSQWSGHNDATNSYYGFTYTGSPQYRHVFIDSDNNAATGYAVGGVGADYMIENGTVYHYSGTNGAWSWAKSVKQVTREARILRPGVWLGRSSVKQIQCRLRLFFKLMMLRATQSSPRHPIHTCSHNPVDL